MVPSFLWSNCQVSFNLKSYFVLFYFLPGINLLYLFAMTSLSDKLIPLYMGSLSFEHPLYIAHLPFFLLRAAKLYNCYSIACLQINSLTLIPILTFGSLFLRNPRKLSSFSKNLISC